MRTWRARRPRRDVVVAAVVIAFALVLVVAVDPSVEQALFGSGCTDSVLQPAGSTTPMDYYAEHLWNLTTRYDGVVRGAFSAAPVSYFVLWVWVGQPPTAGIGGGWSVQLSNVTPTFDVPVSPGNYTVGVQYDGPGPGTLGYGPGIPSGITWTSPLEFSCS